MKCILCDNDASKRHGRLCSSCATKVRRHRLKYAIFEYKGGKCAKCGISGNPSMFDLHHLEPSKKSFLISSHANRSWKVIKAEVDKCELLCANCHRLEHVSDDQKFIDYVLTDYFGGNFSLEAFEERARNRLEENKHVCYKCGKHTKTKNSMCLTCSSKSQERIEWIDSRELKELVGKVGFSAVSRKIGVSGNGIRKRLKNHPPE